MFAFGFGEELGEQPVPCSEQTTRQMDCDALRSSFERVTKPTQHGVVRLNRPTHLAFRRTNGTSSRQSTLSGEAAERMVVVH